jgi:hypothetical protein
MKQKIIIVDNFYENPWEFHQAAINAEYETYQNANYPGRNTTQKFFSEEAHKKLCQILGRKIIPSNDSSCGSFRSVLEDEKGKLTVHSDSFDDWAGVLYLTLPSHCEGKPGTSFYIHKQTGLDHFPTDEEIKMFGWTNVWEIKQGFSTVDTNDPSAWNKYSTIFMRYNRLVLFDTKLWHSTEPGFGNSLNNSRIVQLFFLKNV